ncbi:odorant receptor 22c-like [Fopius arisanus]|uniref:Odorant receptor 22c-like n=1 Tax=Fopius arisanus TaxID=64838 RepID=A0A9R1T880_9HYME|nr:PREDICTED: odorant receptor 22c-like [Fopius arisanus]
MHLVGQLESLNHSLDDVDHLESQEIDDKLAKLSMRHSLLLDLAKGFHTCTNVVIFLILGSNTFIICLSEVMLLWAFNAGDNQTSVDMIIRISLMSVQIFLYSYIGEKFSIQSSKLKLTLYNCPWYKIPPRVARNLQFIMMRNNIPLRLTAE